MTHSFEFPLPTQRDFEDIHACYGALGAENVPSNMEGLATAFPRWRNSIMSPRVVLSRQPDAILATAKALWDLNPRVGPFDSSLPYFNLRLPEGMVPPADWVDAMRAHGVVERTKGTIVIFDSPQTIALPAGFHFSSGSVFDRRLRAHFLDVMRDTFPKKTKDAEELFWSEIFAGLREATGTTRVVVIETGRGKPAAAGLVTSRAGSGYLWCGGVKKSFQRRGLARSLMGLRHLVSLQDGTSRWAYSTSNPRIAHFGHRRFADFCFALEPKK